MKPFTVKELMNWLNISESLQKGSNLFPSELSNRLITGISTDTRTLKPGDLFIAIIGEQFNGHDFILDAAIKGATLALVNENFVKKTQKSQDNKVNENNDQLPLLKVEDTIIALGEIAKRYRQQFKIPIAAVTGSCGKTTVKEMLASICGKHGKALANRGNLNTEIGVPLTLLGLEHDHLTAVIEMGARKKGDIRYLMNIAEPTVSLITNAGVAHIEIFGSAKSIAETKGEIYASLNKTGIAVINSDEPNAGYWHSLLQGQKTITFGFVNEADVSAEIIKQQETESSFVLKTPKGQTEIHLSIPGLHNVSNALAAAAGAIALGMNLTEIKLGLEAFRPVSSRLETKKGLKDAIIIDDTYNANPISVKAALAVLSHYPGERIFVMADMLELGTDASLLHQDIGNEAKRLGINKLLGYGPLTKNAISAFGESGQHYQDKKCLIADLEKTLNPKVAVLIKGSRGMKMEEVVRAIT